MCHMALGVDGEWRRPRSLMAVVLACFLVVSAGAPSWANDPTSAGLLYAFGENRSGELGNTTNYNTMEPNATPTPVELPPASGTVVQAAAGAAHSLVLTSTGQLYSFGNNGYGQLGTEANVGANEPTPALVTLPGAGGPVTQVAAGADHSLVVTSTGQLYAFGANLHGQLGRTENKETFTPNPTPMQVTLPGASGPVTQVAAGGEHSLALTSTGQLYSFGQNESGQLGSPIKETQPTPTLVSLPTGGTVTQIAAGFDHSLVLTSTGQLYAFGENEFGQLGTKENAETLTPNPTPTLVGLPGATGPVAQIAAGGRHSLALTATGQLYAFGENRYGQLGISENDKTEKANPTPELVTLPGAIGPVTEIAAGAYDSLVVTASGQLYAFGYNYYGQLGGATAQATGEPTPTPTLVAFPGGATIDTVARGGSAFHTLALVADLAVTSASLPAGTVGVPYSTSAAAAGGAGPYRWSAAGLPAGLSINPSSGQITGIPSSAGAANVTLTVTDADGIIAISAVIPLTVAAPTAKALTPTPAPTLNSVSLTNRRFRAAKANTAVFAKKTPLGTSFRFTLSTQATLQIKLTQTASGLRRGRSCRAPSPRLRRVHAKPCTRTLNLYTLTRANEPAGADSMPFSGRIAHRALSPRSYMAVLTASNTAGHSKPAALGFTVVR